MPLGVGHAEPVALSIAVDDWARSVRRWSALLGAEPTIRDFTPDGRKRARFAARSVAFMDLIEAGLDVYAGDTTLTLWVPDLSERVEAVRRAGAAIAPVAGSNTFHVRANGVDVLLGNERPPSAGQAMQILPYVVDISVRDIAASAPLWDAIMGVEGTYTSIETDSARQFEMRHYVCAGEMHAIGLMSIPQRIFIKRDSLGSSHAWVLANHGEGSLCVGFLMREGLDAHIGMMAPQHRDLLLFEEPRSYQMGRNNMSHADQTGGVAVVIAQHFPGWDGDPRGARKAE